ncbi:MAG: hypothetical protein AB1916_08730 [Thermodesulfobacteriota bacterium]
MASRPAARQLRGRLGLSGGAREQATPDSPAGLALESGGCVKFDLKAADETLHRVLTGVGDRRTLENFRRAGARTRERPEPPLVAASTCLVTGYLDPAEVGALAREIAAVDPAIPYALPAFHPAFGMADLPPTPRALAEDCLAAAREAGLSRVRLGNVRLLW